MSADRRSAEAKSAPECPGVPPLPRPPQCTALPLHCSATRPACGRGWLAPRKWKSVVDAQPLLAYSLAYSLGRQSAQRGDSIANRGSQGGQGGRAAA